jgi:Family of unknown function (DUF6339)
MTISRLRYLSNETILFLRTNVAANLDRYRHGDFIDLMPAGEWALELEFECDLSVLGGLDPSTTPEAEIANSRLVWAALGRLTPALACEEGIWTRLTHVECLGFTRDRWVKIDTDAESATKLIDDHFFATKLTSRRDDNAISRLWWNAYVANLADPHPALPALDVILKKADIRSNFVERSMTASRPSLAAGMVRIMQRQPSITDLEGNFRAFMRSVNKLGGGIVFEAMPDAEVDRFMSMCAERAGLASGADESSTAPVSVH